MASPSPSPRDRSRRPSRAETRERLLDAALEVFARDGVVGARVEDVCAAAGFSRGAFYSNFASKETLLRALYDRQVARLFTRIDAAMGAPQLDLTDVMAVLDAYEAADGARWARVNAEVMLYAARRPAEAALILERRQHLLERLTDTLRDYWARTRQDVGGEVALAARIALAVYEGAGLQAALEPQAPTAGKLVMKAIGSMAPPAPAS